MKPGKLQKNKQRSQGLRWKVYDCVLFDLCSDTMPVSGLHTSQKRYYFDASTEAQK